MINIHYQKRNKENLCNVLSQCSITEAQYYIPIYTKFFSLNTSNYNNVTFNHTWHLSKWIRSDNGFHECEVVSSSKKEVRNIFFKYAPLLDPYKFLVGKYNVQDATWLKLPTIGSDESSCHSKLLDVNNSAYVDGFFVFLSSELFNKHGFVHGLEYYDSFLGIKKDYTLNIADDLEYLCDTPFFNHHKTHLFHVDNYDQYFQDKKPPIQILGSAKSIFSLHSVDDNLFEDVFENEQEQKDTLCPVEVEEIACCNVEEDKKEIHINSQYSNSTCSSNSLHTEDTENEGENDDEEENEEENEEEEDEEEDEDEDWEDEEDEPVINAYIHQFPVQVIAMEYCEDTFDNLIVQNKLTQEEWFSALMQIIMILLTYQKTFQFTHNDLHTNNVMYNKTNEKYIVYVYNNKWYKVPTFGRIFKLIDFGRSIYNFKGQLFCSDSFKHGEDAATQYNTEPYLNDKKQRIEPNRSFDLCRLGCSLLNYVVDNLEELKYVSKLKSPLKRLIIEWCTDDKGVNVLYDGHGNDRYPDFKLYKMIARRVHQHTPEAQLDRPEFSKYVMQGPVKNVKMVMNVDKMLVYM